MEKWFILVSSLAESNLAERKFQLNFLLFCCNYFSQETLLCYLDLSAIFIFLQKYLLVYLYFVALFFPFLPKNSVFFQKIFGHKTHNTSKARIISRSAVHRLKRYKTNKTRFHWSVGGVVFLCETDDYILSFWHIESLRITHGIYLLRGWNEQYQLKVPQMSCLDCHTSLAADLVFMVSNIKKLSFILFYECLF